MQRHHEFNNRIILDENEEQDPDYDYRLNEHPVSSTGVRCHYENGGEIFHFRRHLTPVPVGKPRKWKYSTFVNHFFFPI